MYSLIGKSKKKKIVIYSKLFKSKSFGRLLVYNSDQINLFNYKNLMSDCTQLRTFKNYVESMEFHSQLPDAYWYLALFTAIFMYFSYIFSKMVQLDSFCHT